LYATGEFRHRLVKLSLTLSPVFLILKDFHRNRLADKLTRLQPAPTLDKSGKNTERDAVAAACAARCSARALVNSRAGNIFNGFERVPVNEKIPALNSI
jgi:hypothetical protein